MILIYLILALIAYKSYTFSRRVKSLNDVPILKTGFLTGTILSELVPEIIVGPLKLSLPGDSIWFPPYRWNRKLNTSIYGMVSWLFTNQYIYVADEEALAQITSNRELWVKPISFYKGLSIFGQSVLTVEGDEHRRHRKITAPSFSETNNGLVWEEALSVCRDWFADMDARAVDGVTDEDVVTSTLRAALHIISSAAFGMKLEWSGQQEIPAGHQMPFREAIQRTLDYLILKIVAPHWAYALPLPHFLKKHLDAANLSTHELDSYMHELVKDRQDAGAQELRKDLLSLLVANSKAEDADKGSLSVQDICGNVFIFLVAGHETTAHTLAFCFALLAVHPEIQDKLYKETSQLPENPDYSTFASLTFTQAVFFEALRLYPAVPHIPKQSTQDTILPCADASGAISPKRQIHIPKGTIAFLDTVGVHYSPRLWGEDASAFRPERFVDTETYHWNRSAFVPFSQGARNCLGQRFAQVESLAIISQVSSRYRLSLASKHTAAYKAGTESYESMLAGVFKASNRLTITPSDIQLVFTKR